MATSAPSSGEATATPVRRSTPGEMAARLGRLTLKELREILRDRRTIVTLVLMPLLVYPLLSIGFRQFFLSRMILQQPTTYRIGFATAAEGDWFREYLGNFAPVEASDAAAAGKSESLQQPASAEPAWFVVEDLETAVKSGTVDLGIRLREPASYLRRSCGPPAYDARDRPMACTTR